MLDELTSLDQNRTWTIVPSLQYMNIICSRWVFKIKQNLDGSTNWYKARLVAKSFNLNSRIDFKETYSPVIKPVTIKLILSIAVSYKWYIRQVDINNAILNGQLIEKVFMTRPYGFVSQSISSHVCKLHKSLYGLKQMPRAWYGKLQSTLRT